MTLATNLNLIKDVKAFLWYHVGVKDIGEPNTILRIKIVHLESILLSQSHCTIIVVELFGNSSDSFISTFFKSKYAYFENAKKTYE